jgi:hypothetical protein
MSSHLFQGSGKFKRLSVQVVTALKIKWEMGLACCNDLLSLTYSSMPHKGKKTEVFGGNLNC